MVATLPMQERDTPFLSGKLFAHFLRMNGVAVEFILEPGEELIIGVDKFPAIEGSHLRQVADNPTGCLKFPIVSQTEEAIIRGYIGEKRKLAATEQAVLTLAGLRPETGQQQHPGRGRYLNPVVTGAFVVSPGVAKTGHGLQGIPLTGIRSRNGVANITAEGFA